MYNFSGLIYRIVAVGGVVFVLGILCLLFSAFWNPKKRDKRTLILALLALVFSVAYIGVYCHRLADPVIEMHEGFFCRENRDSGAAPPLPFTMKYVFSNGDQPMPRFYLDVFSKKEIYPFEFEENCYYEIYYEKQSHVIVRVERVEASTAADSN